MGTPVITGVCRPAEAHVRSWSKAGSEGMGLYADDMPFRPPILLSRRAGEHIDANRLEQAEFWARLAVFAAPDSDSLWFDLGLVYKHQGRWSPAQQANRAATALNPENLGAWWNLGIAATARSDWSEARRAWTGCGIDVPEGPGEPEMDLGLTPIRLNPQDRAEVVWTVRLDPARARIVSVPFPQSEHRYGDVVLHDGSPAGSRFLRGREVPVFDALALLMVSPYSTFHAIVRTALNDELADLDEIAGQHDVEAQNWTAETRVISRAESEGLASRFIRADSTGDVELGIAARSEEEARTFVAAWAERGALREVLDVHLGLAGTQARA